MLKTLNKNTKSSFQRASALEAQIHSYMNGRSMTAERIKEGFYGLASLETITTIVTDSPFFKLKESLVSPLDTGHKADITYDFSPNAPNTKLTICGKKAAKGSSKTLKNVELDIDYSMDIKVVYEGVGNWELNVKKIKVTGPGLKHDRKMKGNPIKENKGYKKNHDTNPIV